jgi:hypothetical protein
MENIVFESLSNKTLSNKKRIAIAFVSIVVLMSFCWQIYENAPFANVSPLFFVGLLCLYALGFRKYICITENGFVVRSRTLMAKSVKVIPWKDITHITVVDRGKISTFYLARNEEIGVKAAFHKDQKEALIEEIKRRNPNIKISSE